MNTEQEKYLQDLINSHDIMLFMKGVPESPMCRFSASTVAMLNTLERPYGFFNILEDPEVRENLKMYSQWPTYPQLYYKGNLIGGNDIIAEMLETGELKTLLSE